MSVIDFLGLNLPQAKLKVRRKGENIEVFDIFRRKWVRLADEEFIRQNFLHWLINERKYPASRIRTEVYINDEGNIRRCDALVYDKNLQPLMILEFKSPTVKITQETFDQIGLYNIELRVKYLIVSNGLSHYCCKIDFINKRIEVLSDIPNYDELE